MHGGIETPISQRERAKSERRGRIIDATFQLLREVGMDDFSIKLVAERAGVAASTVYNLFASRGAVLERVFELDLLVFQQLVDQLGSPDALERIFDAVSVAAQRYRDDPEFFRATMWTRPKRREEDPDTGWAMREPRTRFWIAMVERAIEEKLLRAKTDPRMLGVLMIQITAGVLSDWVLGVISIDQVERETQYGFAILLNHYATKDAARRLNQRITALEASLLEGHWLR